MASYGAAAERGFGAAFSELEHERYLVDNSGRIDVAWGATVIELKTDLSPRGARRRRPKCRTTSPTRLEAGAPGRTTVGLATDGASPARLHAGSRHRWRRSAAIETDVETPSGCWSWLEPAAVTRSRGVMPTPIAVALAFGQVQPRLRPRARKAAAALGRDRRHPEVRLKRDLWDGLLRQVYGDDVGSDALFLQHTYFTILVKAIAARVLDLAIDDPAELLSGRLLANEGIVRRGRGRLLRLAFARGTAAPDLVRTLAGETLRFRLRDVEVDVLKSLYESLIDPDERHDLGEYYTPDWLAARVVAADDPAPAGAACARSVLRLGHRSCFRPCAA